MFDWSQQKVILTGGAGFVGKHVAAYLQAQGVGTLIIPRRANYDLRHEQQVARLFADYPDTTLVLHLAARVGGIGYNRQNPATLFYDNIMMGTLMLDYAYRSGVPKFVGVGTICEYPKFTPVPFKEEDLWNGYPEETNAPYGLAKKMLAVQSEAYRQQYDYNAIHLMPTNLYGPGDNFDPESSHVIPGIITKMMTAKEQNWPFVTLFGDGTPTREFLYVKDAAEGIVMAAADYNEAAPVNLGSGVEISIKELAEMIMEIVGYQGELRWDTDKPNGQPRRNVDVNRAREKFGFRAQTSFEMGLKEVIEWYRSHRPVAQTIEKS